MAGYTPAEKNAILTDEAARLKYISLHTADPGTTGLNEAAGVSRIQVAWGTAANAEIDGAQVGFAVNNGPADFTHVGYWDSLTGGSFRASAQLAVAQHISGTGTVQVTPSLTAI